MHQITLDQELRARLNGLSEPIAVLDETGRTVGHFVPVRGELQPLPTSFPFAMSADEMARRRTEKGGRSLAEIWQDWGIR